jgi:hypothetical protein
MRDVVQINIAASLGSVAQRFGDPRNSPRWMTDLKRYEPISGEQGAPGSKYRLVTDRLDFVATVVEKKLPRSVKLRLEAPDVSVDIDATFSALPSGATRLVSTEEFSFRGLRGKVAGLFARRAIHRVHRRQMEAFKQFVESRG